MESQECKKLYKVDVIKFRYDKITVIKKSISADKTQSRKYK